MKQFITLKHKASCIHKNYFICVILENP